MNVFHIFKWALGIMAGLLALAIAILKYLSSVYESGDWIEGSSGGARVRQWFAKRWEAIANKPWFDTHNYAIEQSLGGVSYFMYCAQRLFRSQFMSRWIAIAYVVLGGIAIWKGSWALRTVGVLLVIVGIIELELASDKPTGNGFEMLILYVLFLPLSLIPPCVTLLLVFKVGIEWGIVIAVVAFPVLCIGARPVSRVSLGIDWWRQKLVLEFLSISFFVFLFAFGMSLLVTLTSMLLGTLIDHDALLPLGFQILLSNMIFDGVTAYVTFRLLFWAVGPSMKSQMQLQHVTSQEQLAKRTLLARIPNCTRLPIAVVVDVLLSAVFGVCSIYFGLLFSDLQLALEDAVTIFIGRRPRADSLYLGPLFWVSHTTFLPTCGYMLLVFVAWIAKLMFSVLAWHFDKARLHKKPLNLTALFLALWSALCAVLAWWLNAISGD